MAETHNPILRKLATSIEPPDGFEAYDGSDSPNESTTIFRSLDRKQEIIVRATISDREVN